MAQKQSEISQRQIERLDEMELTEARVNRETARIAFFDPRKLFCGDGVADHAFGLTQVVVEGDASHESHEQRPDSLPYRALDMC